MPLTAPPRRRRRRRRSSSSSTAGWPRRREGKTLDPAVLAAGVAAGLADPHKGLYFVAEEGGEVVGQLMLTIEWSDWRNGWIWWIQSVYVRPDARRRGVFRPLYEHVHAGGRGRPGASSACGCTSSATTPQPGGPTKTWA